MDRRPTAARPSRRAAILAGLAACWAPHAGRAAAFDAEADRIRDRAKAAGLGPLRVSENEDYLAIGDAPDAFREKALELCLGLAKDYLKHFKDKGFAVAKPPSRMTLVVLSGREAFAAFVGEGLALGGGGIYDPETNHLVLYDNRDGATRPGAEQDNTLVLFHEATHQLTFNTGLLTRDGDVPLAIAEGLGTYGESRSVNGRTKLGSLNPRRLEPIAPRAAGRRFQPTISPVAEMIASDRALLEAETAQRAYSEAWLLVYFLMKTPARTAQFREYLRAIAPRRDPSRRMDDWTAAFGDPTTMDKELSRFAAKLRS